MTKEKLLERIASQNEEIKPELLRIYHKYDNYFENDAVIKIMESEIEAYIKEHRPIKRF
jgi:hypothetical protein